MSSSSAHDQREMKCRASVSKSAPAVPKACTQGRFGSVGNGNFSKNVRLLYLNGIRNSFSDCDESANAISRIANSQVFYFYSQLGLFDSYFFTKKVAEAGKEVAERVKQLFQEIHQEAQEEKTSGEVPEQVIVMTHSAGGLVWKKAAEYLNSEEKKKITLLTFASTYMFPSDSGFKKVKNFVNRRDWISRLSRLRRTGGEVTFIGQEEKKRCWEPISEHFFLNSVYQRALKKELQELQSLDRKGGITTSVDDMSLCLCTASP